MTTLQLICNAGTWLGFFGLGFLCEWFYSLLHPRPCALCRAAQLVPVSSDIEQSKSEESEKDNKEN